MGEVAEAVKGGSKKAESGAGPDGGNLQQRVQEIADEVSRLTTIKDDDVLKEGTSAKSENTRKAALLRATYSLLRAAKTLLDDY